MGENTSEDDLHPYTQEERNEQAARSFRSKQPFFTSPAFTAVISQWMIQNDPTSSTLSAAMRQARRLCGHWVALRRLILGLSGEVIERESAVNAMTLLLLETGLANEGMASDEAWNRLFHMLAIHHHDVDWVAAVIEVAIGRRSTISEQMVAEVGRQVAVIKGPE